MARQRDATEQAARARVRSEPDEAALVEDEGTGPQREHAEPRLPDPDPEPGDLSPWDLSGHDWLAIGKRAGKQSLADQVTDLAAALAYYSFLAIPAALLTAFGLLGLIAPQHVLHTVATKLASVGPGQASGFLGNSIERLGGNPGETIPMTVVGFLLALWTTTGAMTAFMRALNRVYQVEEGRGFVKQRLVAMRMVGIIVAAFALVFVLMIVGPNIAGWLGGVVGIGGWMQVIWWVAQWPILLSGLLAAFATLHQLGPNVVRRRRRFVTPGALVAAVVWVVASGLFAVYTANFGSYNQTWGSLSAVIIMLMWIWITGLALLFGAEVNVEAERSRELRTGEEAAGRRPQPERQA